MDTNYTFDIYGKSWLSKFLKADELELIETSSTTVSYNKRDVIAKKGEFAKHVMVLQKGFVKVELKEGKKNFIVGIISSPNIIGFSTLLSCDKHLFDVVALTDAIIQFIPVEVLKDIIESNGKFAFAAITHGTETFTIPMLEKLQCLSQNNIRGRLAKLLLQLSRDTHRSTKFSLLISRSEMAEMIGFSRENVIRMLTEFQKEGIIKLHGKTIEFFNADKLEKYAMYS